MAVDHQTIERPCNYELVDGAENNILKGNPFPIGVHNGFNIQVFTENFKAGTTCKIFLQISNDGENFASTGDEITVSGNTDTNFILIPANQQGVASSVYCRIGIKNIATVEPNNEIIKKAIFSTV